MMSQETLSRIKKLCIPLLAYIGIRIVLSFLTGPEERDDRTLLDFASAGFVDFVLVAVIYFLCVRWLEKRPVDELKLQFKPMVYALLAAILILGIPTLLQFVLGNYQIVASQTMDLMIYAIIALFLQGVTSEILFRGIFYRNIAAWIGPWLTMMILSSIYGALNMLLDGVHVQVFVGHGLFFCVLSLIYLKTNNLWVTGSFHGTWLVVAFLPGVVDEHWREGAAVITKVEGNVWMSGGQWGAELSIFCLLMLAMTSVFLYRQQVDTSNISG